MCSIITAFELHPVESRVISTSLVWLHLGSEAADRSSPRAYGSGPGTMESIPVQIYVRRPDPGEAMRHPVPSPGFVDGSLVLAVPEPESVGAGIVAMFVAPLWPKADPHNSPPFRHIFPASPRALPSLSRSEHLSVRALQSDRVDAGVVIVVVLGDERSFSLITFCLHLHSNHIFTFLTVAPPPPSAPVGCYIWLQNWNWFKRHHREAQKCKILRYQHTFFHSIPHHFSTYTLQVTPAFEWWWWSIDRGHGREPFNIYWVPVLGRYAGS